MAIVLSEASVLTVDTENRFLPAADIRVEGRIIEVIDAPGTLAWPGPATASSTAAKPW